jgi:hypothetical protein
VITDWPDEWDRHRDKMLGFPHEITEARYAYVRSVKEGKSRDEAFAELKRVMEVASKETKVSFD